MKTGKALWQIQAEKDFENSFEIETNEIRWDEAETHENVEAAYGGWEAGTYVRENDNGTSRIMRTAPKFEANPKLIDGLTAFLSETDENRASVIHGTRTFDGVSFNPGYGAIYSEPDESTACGNDFNGGMAYASETLRTEEAITLAVNRLASATEARLGRKLWQIGHDDTAIMRRLYQHAETLREDTRS